MSHNLFRPYDESSRLGLCRCGLHDNQGSCNAAALAEQRRRAEDSETLSADFVEAAAVHALLPHEPTRRAFLKAVGAGTAMAAISSVLPLDSLKAMAAETKTRGHLEKANLNIGFIPITCATPLIMADPMGFYAQEGLKVTLNKVAGWALVRDRMMNRELDATHFLAPMPLAITMGVGSAPQNMEVASIQNINGQALTMSLQHVNNRNPKNWKGMVFAIPFEHSMHNYLLRYFLAEHGLDPDRDVQLRLTSPADMIANMRAGNIDGFFGPEPFNQRAVFDKVGYIHTLSRNIWNGHPCCAFGTSKAFIEQNPNTFLALYRAILSATATANKPENRREVAKAISGPNYLNQPEIVVRQVLTGRFADGVGKVQDYPDRTGFDALPWHSFAIWMLTQMKRWGYVKGEVDYRGLADKVFMLTDAKKQMQALGQQVPAGGDYPGFSVMGKPFDPLKPDAYVASFNIRR